MSYNFEVQGGKSYNIPVGGKYCPEDIVLTVKGGSSSETLIINTNEGATVTVTNGVETYTGAGPVAVFEGLEAGEWIVTATQGGKSKTKTAEIGVDTLDMSIVHVYGISRGVSASSPTWGRTDDAVGFTATASVGTVAGSSDFDNCYPWSEIQRETLSTGDVMVKIPKFYFLRYRENGIEYIKIADSKKEGFDLHPVFNHGGIECDYIYVGAYKTSSGHKSVTGVAPLTNLTRADMRTGARSKGSGWGLMDIAAMSAIQMLMLVEFATYNTQSVIGRGYCDKTSGGSSIITGSCNNVPNLTGRPSGTNGLVDVVWRGIEGVWGNCWEWIDGVNQSATKYYVCNNPSNYADDTTSNYVALSFDAISAASAYITEEGFDMGPNNHIILPSAAGTGSESTYICDGLWSGVSGWKSLRFYGGYDDGSKAGLFTGYFMFTSSSTDSSTGGRLLYIPA